MKKSMKKTLAVLVALCLMFGLVACTGGGQKESPYVGNWKLTSASMSGITLDPSTLGMDMSINIKADGSADLNLSMSSENTNGAGKWEETENGVKITEADGQEAITLTMVDGKLEGEQDGVKMIFEKQAQ